jgi:DNA-binding MarR family transcriptional regulator
VARKVQPVRADPELKSWPQYDHKSRECFLNLERTHIVVRPLFERLFRPYGLSASTFNILMILRSSETPLAPHAIGQKVVVTRPTVTGLLNSLESQGLITREPDPLDGRRVRVTLTKLGTERVEAVLPEVFALQKQIFASLTAQEKATFIALLGKIQATADAASRKKRTLLKGGRPAVLGTRSRRNGYIGQANGVSRRQASRSG